jgi:hypothetical protein
VHKVIASTLTPADIPVRGSWVRVRVRVRVRVEIVDSWMLPGQAVRLLWRPVTGTESRHGPDRW